MRKDAAEGKARRSKPNPTIDIYARLSYAANGETVKVDDQLEMGQEALEARGAVVGMAHKDNSLSAWQPGVVRPEWEVLMERLEAGVADGVWVYDLSRFSRKIIEGERLVELAAKGIRVWAMAGEYNLNTADGRRAFRESMVAAAAESDKISERVKRGKLRRARKGRSSTGLHSFAMPGYLPRAKDAEPGDPRELVSEEQLAAERAIVIECYDRLLAGESVSALVQELNKRGVPGPLGGRWTRAHLARTMKRPALAGLLIHDGTIMGAITGVEPVVTREQWERLCAVFDGRKRGRPAGVPTQTSSVHLLSGLVTCPNCGWPLTGMSRASSLSPYPDGAPRREYRCIRTADRPGCGRNFIDARVVENAVDEAMRTRLGDPRRAAKMAQHLSKVTEQRASIQAEISNLEQTADELATKTALWGTARVDKAMGPVMSRLDVLKRELSGLESPAQADTAAADAVRAWDEAREREDFTTMRAMIKRTFPHLTLTPPRKYKDHNADRLIWEPTREQMPPARAPIFTLPELKTKTAKQPTVN